MGVAHVRGANVNRPRYLYTVAGGAIAGLAITIFGGLDHFHDFPHP